MRRTNYIGPVRTDDLNNTIYTKASESIDRQRMFLGESYYPSTATRRTTGPFLQYGVIAPPGEYYYTSSNLYTRPVYSLTSVGSTTPLNAAQIYYAAPASTWSNVNNILTDDSNAATAWAASPAVYTYGLAVYNLGLSIPTDAVVRNIYVKVKASCNDDYDSWRDVDVRLTVWALTILGCNNLSTGQPVDTTKTTHTFGGSVESWGLSPESLGSTWPEYLNSSLFGCKIAYQQQTAGGVTPINISVFYMQLVVEYYLTTDPTSQIQVASGSAVTANGQLISVAAPFTIDYGADVTNGSWSDDLIDYDGLISETSYPVSYVKLQYQGLGSSPSTDRYGNTIYTRYTPSYFVSIDTNPPTGDQVLLASFAASRSGSILSGGLFYDERFFTTYRSNAASVYLDPVSKNVSAHTTALDHVTAYGSNTPSATNPHGIRYDDIGAAPASSSVSLYSFAAPTGSIAYLPGTIYQNTFAGPMAVSIMGSASVTRLPEGGVGQVDITYVEVYLKSSATASGSALTGTVYTHDHYYIGRGIDELSANLGASRSGSLSTWFTVFGIIPPSHYYQLSTTFGGATLGNTATASIIGGTNWL